ncbi:MAG: YggS family pyridoxal phosphate-dependent enzyme [Gammaproteobacteria bacterium]|nr:YggS family pyridoxal phosphate-dependent enzyme [Gammaproteobacteria bacterium]
MQNIEKNLSSIRQQISLTAIKYSRDPREILLLAVSKKKPASDIRTAYACGQCDFGENYLQEAEQKIVELNDLDISWHFIGAVQSNKTKAVAQGFSWVHCIDRLKIARRLSEQRSPSMPALNVCIQVNIEQEDSKSGVSLPEVPELARQIAVLPNLRLRGLMTIPAPVDDFESQRKPFSRLREMLETLNQNGLNCDTMSMGMTHDMPAAIAEGATLVRIGTAVFGERP